MRGKKNSEYPAACRGDLYSRNQGGCTPFREVSRNNQVAAMEVLWKHGANIEVRDSGQTTPLIGCAKGGKLEATTWLLDHGADIRTKDKCGKTALDWARENGRRKIVELLQLHMDS